MLNRQWVMNTFCNIRTVILMMSLVLNLALAGVGYNQYTELKEYRKESQIRQEEFSGLKTSLQDEMEKQWDQYYTQRIQKLLSEQDVSFLAQKQWKYVLTLNGEIVQQDIIYISDQSVHMILAEVVEDKDILPWELLQKGTITGSDPNDHLQDHLPVVTNIPYVTKVEEAEQGRRVIYDFKDIPKGTVISLKPSVLLKDRLGIGDEITQWNSHIEIIRK